jgi:ATP/maltotriose-dependent transcriptional regulator MalT
VKTHLEELFERLDVASRAEAVAVGVRRGLLML